MDKVVFLEDGRTVLRLPADSPSPPGSSTFLSPEEMASSLDLASMDAARMSMLKAQGAVRSPDVETAARLLWSTIMELVPGFAAQLPRKLARQLDSFGNPRNPTRGALELIALSYKPGEDRMKDFFYAKLSKQEKAILEIFASQEREIWTKEQADELIVANADKLATKQDPMVVFKYYRGSLLERRFLRRVSWEEFAKKHPGVSLL